MMSRAFDDESYDPDDLIYPSGMDEEIAEVSERRRELSLHDEPTETALNGYSEGCSPAIYDFEVEEALSSICEAMERQDTSTALALAAALGRKEVSFSVAACLELLSLINDITLQNPGVTSEIDIIGLEGALEKICEVAVERAHHKEVQNQAFEQLKKWYEPRKLHAGSRRFMEKMVSTHRKEGDRESMSGLIKAWGSVTRWFEAAYDDVVLRKQPIQIRETAYELFTLGQYSEAEDLLMMLLGMGFCPADIRAHLARLCLITDRLAEAGEHIRLGWTAHEDAEPYVIARLLWFEVALALLTEPRAEGRVENIHLILGRLKALLGAEHPHMAWTMNPVLDHLKPKLTDDGYALLAALAATLTDRQHLPELEEYSMWRNAVPSPLEEPAIGLSPSGQP